MPLEMTLTSRLVHGDIGHAHAGVVDRFCQLTGNDFARFGHQLAGQRVDDRAGELPVR